MTTHPSFFELDVYAVAPSDDETARHVRDCQQCSAHVAAVKMPTPFPQALVEQFREPAPSRQSFPLFVRAMFAMAALMLVVAVAGIVKFMSPHEEVITPKGAPAASLWLKRGASVTQWKGERLTRDAAVRWEIAPAGFTHVRVYDTESNEVLFEAKVSGDAPVKTPAWTFDGARSTEKIRVVLTRDDAPPSETCAADGQQWCSEYVLELQEP